MVAIGLVPSDEVVRNSTAPAGAALYLTKPLGLGIVSTAIKRGIAEEDLVDAAVDLMTTTNRAAGDAMRDADAEAATDVTGFGLLGHLHRMLLASGTAAQLEVGAPSCWTRGSRSRTMTSSPAERSGTSHRSGRTRISPTSPNRSA